MKTEELKSDRILSTIPIEDYNEFIKNFFSDFCNNRNLKYIDGENRIKIFLERDLSSLVINFLIKNSIQFVKDIQFISVEKDSLFHDLVIDFCKKNKLQYVIKDKIHIKYYQLINLNMKEEMIKELYSKLNSWLEEKYNKPASSFYRDTQFTINDENPTIFIIDW